MSVSNHHPRDCLLNCLFRRRSVKTSKLRVTGLLGAGNSPWTGEFPSQRASTCNAENVSIWWHHHARSTFPEPDVRTYISRNNIVHTQLYCTELVPRLLWHMLCFRGLVYQIMKLSVMDVVPFPLLQGKMLYVQHNYLAVRINSIKTIKLPHICYMTPRVEIGISLWPF